MNINQTIIKYLTRLAENNEGTKGKWKLASGVVHKGNLVATGVNSYKSSPFAARFSKNPEAIFLHAETDAIKSALKVLTLKELSRSSLYVVRVKKDGSYGNSCPCIGCTRAISEFSLRETVYYCETEGWVVS